MAVTTLRAKSSKEKVIPFQERQFVTYWTRNTEWLVMPSVLATDEKVVILAAIYPDNNYFALIANGAYNVNWGDGTSSLGVAPAATASAIITYTSIAGNTEVGIASAQAVTFITGTNIVTLTNHGYLANEEIAFSVTTIPEVTQYTKYYVTVVSVSTFTISATCRGAVLSISSGTGSVYTPQYRQVLITLTPVVAGTFTLMKFNVKHPILPLPTIGFIDSQILDIVMSGPNLTDIFLGSNVPGSVPASPGSPIFYNMLQSFKLL